MKIYGSSLNAVALRTTTLSYAADLVGLLNAREGSLHAGAGAGITLASHIVRRFVAVILYAGKLPGALVMILADAFTDTVATGGLLRHSGRTETHLEPGRKPERSHGDSQPDCPGPSFRRHRRRDEKLPETTAVDAFWRCVRPVSKPVSRQRRLRDRPRLPASPA